MAAKKSKKPVQRTRMTDEQVEKFLKKHLKDRDLKGAEAERAIRRCAATRWAALERNAKKSKK